MKNKFYKVLMLAMLVTGSCFAQQDGQFTQYMFNTLYFNPGFAGMEGAPKFTLLHRNQWANYRGMDGGGSPVTQVLTFNAPLMRLNSGVGIHVVNDQLGPLNNVEAQLSYSYHFNIGGGKLGIGARGGVYSMSINRGIFRPRESGDVIVEGAGAPESQFRPDLAVGVWYQAAKYFGGIGVSHVLRPRFDFGVPAAKDPSNPVSAFGNPLERHYNITAGYNYEMTYSWMLTPTINVMTDLNRTMVQGGAIATYNDRFWGGLNYRYGDAIGILGGVSMLKDNALRLGFAYDFTTPNVLAKTRSSYEVMLTYMLPPAVVGAKPVIRTPRFRH
jgi:type IX secretion system PorP/SprF family membrane protein